MNNLFLVYFVNFYTFRAYLGPSSGATTECIQELIFIIFFSWLSVVLVGLSSNPTRTTDSYLKRIININSCIHSVVPPDDGPTYARNVQRLTKYTKNKLCIQVGFSLHNYIEMHGQQNIYIQGVTGGTDQTSGECSLGHTIPI